MEGIRAIPQGQDIPPNFPRGQKKIDYSEIKVIDFHAVKKSPEDSSLIEVVT